MRSTSVVPVVRYLLLDRFTYLVLPWEWAGFGFVLDAVILRLTPAGDGGQRWVGGLAAAFLVVFVIGLQSVAKALPFAMALGVGRRTYQLAAGAVAVGLGVCFGLVVTLGRLVERVTGGWGLRMAYFRVPFLLDGPWYLAWLTASVSFVLLFAYGMAYGLVHRRAGLTGTMIFGAGQLAVLTLAAVVTTWLHGWADVGRFLTGLTAAGLTAVLAAVAALLLAGGYAGMRRLTV
jgi:hypothetical protein